MDPQNNPPAFSLPLLFGGFLLLILVGVGGFYLGKNSSKQNLPQVQVTPTAKPIRITCTLEAKICPDGSSVGRTGPNCEFAPCPITTPFPTQIIQISPTSNTTHYVCPQNGWIDCMPILTEEKKKACSPEAISWYKENCPNFKGGAL